MSDEDVPIPLRWGGTYWLEPLMVSAGYGLDKLIELGRKGYTRLHEVGTPPPAQLRRPAGSASKQKKRSPCDTM